MQLTGASWHVEASRTQLGQCVGRSPSVKAVTRASFGSGFVVQREPQTADGAVFVQTREQGPGQDMSNHKRERRMLYRAMP